MAFKLNKAQQKRRDGLESALTENATNLERVVENFNEAIAAAWEKVEDAVSGYNDVLTEAREFRDEIVGAMQDEMSNKSEKWQESERASEVQSWVEEWEGAELDDVELTKPDEIDFSTPEHDVTLGDLPVAPGE
jgi:hypothetical protein